MQFRIHSEEYFKYPVPGALPPKAALGVGRPLFVPAPVQMLPEPAADDVGAEDDDDDDKKPESGTCIACEKQHPNPLTPKNDILELTTAVLVKEAYKNYSESTDVIKMIAAARENIADNPGRYISRRKNNGKSKKMTFCYRAVKGAMRESGLVPSVFIGGGLAKNAVSDLKPIGFRNLLDDENVKDILKNNPRMAPKGSILVYETVPGAKASSAGHIEIKTDDAGSDGYISISETERPTYGYPVPQVRRLIGVLIRDRTKN